MHFYKKYNFVYFLKGWIRSEGKSRNKCSTYMSTLITAKKSNKIIYLFVLFNN